MRSEKYPNRTSFSNDNDWMFSATLAEKKLKKKELFRQTAY